MFLYVHAYKIYVATYAYKNGYICIIVTSTFSISRKTKNKYFIIITCHVHVHVNYTKHFIAYWLDSEVAVA